MRAGVLLHVVAPLEALDATGGIDDALLAREERVALAADLGVQPLLGGARLERVAARADDGRFNVVGMDLGLPGSLGSSLPAG